MTRLFECMKVRRGFVGLFPFLAQGLVVLAVGATGYWCGFRTSTRAPVVSARDIASVDYFRERLSFSEINEEEARVRASALRLITELRDRRADHVIPFGWNSATGKAIHRSELEKSRIELEQILGRTFDADSRELLVKELLFVLKQLNDDDQWLSVYLDSLYRFPARELTGLMAADAVRAGIATRREHHVLDAFQHVLSIPMDLPAKDKLRAAASQLTSIATSFADHNAGSM